MTWVGDEMSNANATVPEMLRSMSREEARQYYLSEYGADAGEAEMLVNFSHPQTRSDILDDLPASVAASHTPSDFAHALRADLFKDRQRLASDEFVIKLYSLLQHYDRLYEAVKNATSPGSIEYLMARDALNKS